MAIRYDNELVKYRVTDYIHGAKCKLGKYAYSGSRSFQVFQFVLIVLHL